MSEHTIKKPLQRSSPAKPRAKKITETYLHNSGLYYLQRFASSKANFITVMSRKIRKSCHAHPEQNYNDCLEKLIVLAHRFENCGLLNDGVYITNMIISLRRRGYSRSAILQKLAQKGIDRETANSKLQLETSQQYQNLQNDMNPELTAAIAFAKRKKLGPFAIKLDENSTKKHLSCMARAGYSYEIASKVLKTSHSDLPY